MNWIIEGFRMVGLVIAGFFGAWLFSNLLEVVQRWLDRRSQ